jgi:predicted dehydrogenase
MPESKTLAIGMIGCGKMAMELARRCVNLNGRIVAVYDPNPEAAQSAVDAFQAERMRDEESLCADSRVEAVMVGSPCGAHLANVLTAAKYKKPVYCEKPLGVSVAQCDQMIAACKEAGVPLFVGQVLRLFPLFWLSKQLIEAGKIGQPRAVSITRAGYASHFVHGWRTSFAMTGGLLMEINAHEFDYMRFLLGEAVEIYAKLDNLFGAMEYDDQGYVLVTFASGATACLHTSLSSPIGEYRVHIQGTKGNMVHGGFGGTLRYQTRDGSGEEFSADQVAVANPYDHELSSWIRSLTEGTKPLFSGEDGRAAVAMAEAAYLSAREGRVVRLNEVAGG